MKIISRVIITFLLPFTLWNCHKISKPELISKSYIKQSSLAKNDLYKKILSWVVKTNNKYLNDIIQFKDIGHINTKGMTSFQSLFGISKCEYTLSIDVEDYKYKAVFDDFNFIWEDYNTNTSMYYTNRMPVTEEDYIYQLHNNSDGIIDNLESFLNSNNAENF